MRFADPIWLLVGAAAVAILFVLLARAEHKRTAAMALLAGARLRPAHAALPSRFRRWLRVGVVTFAVAMGFVALARPQKGLHWETVQRNGIDLLLVVDTSRSMDADDVKPTRLERVKLGIRDLVGRFPGDRIGLVAFAGDALVESPMTLDHDALLETVDALDTSTVARGGTDIGRAIEVATAALATEPGHQKAVVLVSDGEDLEGRGLAEAKKADAQGIIIDTVGVGSAAGELVPARDERGQIVGVVRDEGGQAVRSHLDEAGMRNIAVAAHGTYRPLGADGQGLDRLYRDSLAARAHVEASSRTHRVYSERFEVPLGLALLALMLDALLGLPWRRRASRSWVSGPVATAAAALLAVVVPRPAHASISTAEKTYAAGHFAEAAEAYEAEAQKHPKDPRLSFDAGDAAYRARKYDAAVAAFGRVMAAGDPKLQEQALYNRGDALYRAGDEQKATAQGQTIEQWKAAIASYEGAMALDSKDADARYNRDFVKRKLDELEKKQEDEKKQQDKESKGDKGDKQSKGDKGGKDSAQNGADGKQDKKDSSSQGGAPKPDPSGAPSAGTVNGGQPHAETGNKAGAASPQRASAAGADQHTEGLSAQEARSLLGALRGEEHHGALRAADAGAPPDDTPRKDW